MRKKTVLDYMDSHQEYLTELVMLYTSKADELFINDSDLLVFIKHCASLCSMIREFQCVVIEKFD